MLIAKDQPGTAPGGHEWTYPGEAVDVPDELARQLVGIAGFTHLPDPPEPPPGPKVDLTKAPAAPAAPDDTADDTAVQPDAVDDAPATEEPAPAPAPEPPPAPAKAKKR